MTPLEHLVRRWQAGWSLARDWTDYTDRDGIVRLRIGEPARMAEYLVTDEEPDRLRRAAELAGSDGQEAGASWLTVVTRNPARTRAGLEDHGLDVVRSEWLMTAALTDGGTAATRSGVPVRTLHASPGGPSYRVATDSRPGLIDVRVSTAADSTAKPAEPGSVAAGGRMAVLGTDAVADRITTEPAHRRRGLGRAVMHALVTAAVRQGATDGLLVASRDGLHLYRALGWSTAADIVIARSR